MLTIDPLGYSNRLGYDTLNNLIYWVDGRAVLKATLRQQFTGTKAADQGDSEGLFNLGVNYARARRLRIAAVMFVAGLSGWPFLR